MYRIAAGSAVSCNMSSECQHRYESCVASFALTNKLIAIKTVELSLGKSLIQIIAVDRTE
jgi:hypothetical protein